MIATLVDLRSAADRARMASVAASLGAEISVVALAEDTLSFLPTPRRSASSLSPITITIGPPTRPLVAPRRDACH